MAGADPTQKGCEFAEAQKTCSLRILGMGSEGGTVPSTLDKFYKETKH